MHRYTLKIRARNAGILTSSIKVKYHLMQSHIKKKEEEKDILKSFQVLNASKFTV